MYFTGSIQEIPHKRTAFEVKSGGACIENASGFTITEILNVTTGPLLLEYTCAEGKTTSPTELIEDVTRRTMNAFQVLMAGGMEYVQQV